MPRSRPAEPAHRHVPPAEPRREVRETSVTAAFPPHFFVPTHVSRGELAVDLTALARALDLGGSAGGRGLRAYLDTLVTQHATARALQQQKQEQLLPPEDVVSAPLQAPCFANESAALHAVVRCFADGMVPYPKPINVLDVESLLQRQHALATARLAAAAAAAAASASQTPPVAPAEPSPRSAASCVAIASLVDPVVDSRAAGASRDDGDGDGDGDADACAAAALLVDAKRGRFCTAPAAETVSTEELNAARLLDVVRRVRATYGLPPLPLPSADGGRAVPALPATGSDLLFGVTLVDYVRGGRRTRHQELFVVCREVRRAAGAAPCLHLPVLSFYSRFVELAERAAVAAALAGGAAAAAGADTPSSGALYKMQKHEENAWFVCAVLDLKEQPLCRAMIEDTALQYPEIAVSLDPLRLLDEYKRYLMRDKAPPRALWNRSTAQQQRRHKERVRAEVTRLRQLQQQQLENGLSPCTITPSSCSSPALTPAAAPAAAPADCPAVPVPPPPAPLLLCLAQQTVDTALHDSQQ